MNRISDRSCGAFEGVGIDPRHFTRLGRAFSSTRTEASQGSIRLVLGASFGRGGVGRHLPGRERLTPGEGHDGQPEIFDRTNHVQKFVQFYRFRDVAIRIQVVSPVNILLGL